MRRSIRKYAWLVLIAGICIGFVVWCWESSLEPFVATVQLKVFSSSSEESASTRIGADDVRLRMRGAVESLWTDRSIGGIVTRFRQNNPGCSDEYVRMILQDVRVTRSEEDPYVWRVTAFARSHNESREVAELVASRVIGYFDAERHGLCEKMSAWFDQQIYHQRRKGEDPSALEQQKRDALAAEETKAFVVRKTGVEISRGSREAR